MLCTKEGGGGGGGARTGRGTILGKRQTGGKVPGAWTIKPRRR